MDHVGSPTPLANASGRGWNVIASRWETRCYKLGFEPTDQFLALVDGHVNNLTYVIEGRFVTFALAASEDIAWERLGAQLAELEQKVLHAQEALKWASLAKP